MLSMAAGGGDQKQNTPGWIRTSDLRIRSPLLYPAELRARTVPIKMTHELACGLSLARIFLDEKREAQGESELNQHLEEESGHDYRISI